MFNGEFKMADLCVQIPDQLNQELEESDLDVPGVVKEALVSKLFEKQLSQSKSLQKAMFEMLIAKSKLTKKGAKELAERVNLGMLEDLKEKLA